MTATIRMAKDGVLEVVSDYKRSNPANFEYHWSGRKPSDIKITTEVPVFGHENSLRVGFLTAAYGLWFKNFGYSFVLQNSMNVVRDQINNPEHVVMPWNYTIETPYREIDEPSVGLMRFGSDLFPMALIYDHIVILPNPSKMHPENTEGDEISHKLLRFEPVISSRFRHRCAGPAAMTCNGQEIIHPDLIQKTTVPIETCRLDRWD